MGAGNLKTESIYEKVCISQEKSYLPNLLLQYGVRTVPEMFKDVSVNEIAPEISKRKARSWPGVPLQKVLEHLFQEVELEQPL